MSSPERPCRRFPPGHRRVLFFLFALALATPLGLATGGEDDDALPHRVELSKARLKELTERRHDEALRMYAALLEEPVLDADIRGDALLGLARCYRALGQLGQAEDTWKRVLRDETLPLKVREQAEKDWNAVKAERGRVDQTQRREEDFQRLLARRREEAQGLVAQAQRAFDDGRLELARQLCLDAKKLGPGNVEADALLARINRAIPDRSELLREMLKFAETTHAQGFRRLKTAIGSLSRSGIDAYKAEDLETANQKFREALERIDGGEFFADLLDERDYVLRWLRRTIEEGKAKGLDLGPEPPPPDLSHAAPGWRRQFYDLLSRVFTAQSEQEDPLAIYEFRPAAIPEEADEPKLVAGAFPQGMSATRETGALTRSRWAERWIRTHVGTGWYEGTATGRNAPRMLSRFGDTLIVQNNRAAHRKVRDLRATFPETGRPVAVDIAVFAATTPGGTRLVSLVGGYATPRDSGFDLVVSNRLFEECLARAVPVDDTPIQGLQRIGTARVLLAGHPSATIEITQRAEKHPAYDGLPPPPPILGAEDARYGLRLALYAEDLVRAQGAPRCAVGVRALTRVPQGTVVVPKAGARGAWARLPRPMEEQVIEAWRILPHAGTLIIQGLANPFPESARSFPGLIVLIGARPTDPTTGRVPLPEIPLPTAPEGAGSTGPREREYALGPLATEVADEVLEADWPRRPATVPVVPAVARKARERYLANRLGIAWSGLAEPGKPSPVEVLGSMATASLPAGGHARLLAAVHRLRAQETALYDIDVVTAEVAHEMLAEWLRVSAAQAFTHGTWLITSPAGERALDQRMRSRSASGGLYTLQARLLARATQRVGAENLRVLSIVEDIRLWRNRDGVMRYNPVPGRAEEGLIVLVRPELEEGGRRLVLVDARAARLKALERIRLPDVELPAARVTAARYHPVTSRSIAAPLGDDEAVLLSVPAPEGAGRVIVVKVRTQKVQ